jgi:hypothetical protein
MLVSPRRPFAIGKAETKVRAADLGYDHHPKRAASVLS